MITEPQIQVERISNSQAALSIAVVTETYPPDINGVAHTLSKIVQGLQARGHVIWLVRPRQPGTDVAMAHAGYQELLVRGLPIPFYRQLRLGLPAKRELLRLWTRQRPDVVHIATEGPLGWSALQVARKLKLPISTDFRTNFHAYSQHYGIGWLRGAILAYMKKFHNSAHATMVPTAQLEGELAASGFKRLSVVPRGIDIGLFSPTQRVPELRQSWGAAEQDRVMIYVGRLAVEKNLGAVIACYRAMKLQHPDLKLVLVGDGPMRAELQQKHPDIVFAGFRVGQDLAQHYASADMFMFASKTETFGNVTIEAMASGLAVVAFRHAAAGELITSGVNGMLAEPSDDPGFSMAAQILLSDRSRMRAIGEQGCRTAHALGWPKVVEMTESIFQKILLEQGAPVARAWPVQIA
ncbi:MAG: glycosyltransferase family 1 protein [Rhodoferax sp.]|nr:glycosyltransferase family 1 protein [Rhodoferax sp.]